MLERQPTPDSPEASGAIVCSLDPAGLADRLAEFQHLFASTLVSRERRPAQLRLVLTVPPDGEPAVRTLLAREAECCTFFSFAIAREESRLVVTMGVPPGAETMLDEFDRLAAGAALL
jgi:hypothetical protein